MYLKKVTSRKNGVKKLVFSGILKVNDENIRIRIRIRIWIRIRIRIQDPLVRGMDPRKCHGSGTLLFVYLFFFFYNTYIHNIRRGKSTYILCLHSCRLSGRNLHGVPSPRFELGPALQRASALPSGGRWSNRTHGVPALPCLLSTYLCVVLISQRSCYAGEVLQ
jgi:hypothetical protein